MMSDKESAPPIPGKSLRKASVRRLVRKTRGLYKGRTGKRSLVDELLAERRKEAERETALDDRQIDRGP